MPDLPFDYPRFWSKVDLDGPTQSHMETNCWVWTAATTKGYGSFRFPNGPAGLAHKFSWQEANQASVLGEYQLDHLCGVPSCIRPDHLEIVTPAENMRRLFASDRYQNRHIVHTKCAECGVESSNPYHLCDSCALDTLGLIVDSDPMYVVNLANRSNH